MSKKSFPVTPEKEGADLQQSRSYPTNINPDPAGVDIDLYELWSVIFQGKWVIFAVSAFFAVASVIYALQLPNIYRAESLIAPSEDSEGGLSRMAGQLGGLASLAGINIGTGSADSKIAIATEVLKSRQFITKFIDDYELLPELMAVERWDRINNKLILNNDVYDVSEEKWIRNVKPPRASEPSLWEAYKEFNKILSVTQDKSTGFVTVVVEHQSPFIAAHWVNLLVKEVNEVMKRKEMEEARRSIHFLQQQLDGVALADMRKVFYQLIEEQTKTIMLAEVREEYVFSTIDPSMPPEEKTKPNRAIICLLATIMGGLISTLYIVFRHYLSPSRGHPNVGV